MEDFTHYIDPASVPKHKLASGDMIPAIGMGTFGSDNYDSQTIANAAREAVLMGYRHIDCASVYGNEKEIGTTVLSELIHEGVVRRDELWITSKVWNDHARRRDRCLQTVDEGLESRLPESVPGTLAFPQLSCSGSIRRLARP
jgi:diketogulonate reductase-like aldo/keto reductase